VGSIPTVSTLADRGEEIRTSPLCSCFGIVFAAKGCERDPAFCGSLGRRRTQNGCKAAYVANVEGSRVRRELLTACAQRRKLPMGFACHSRHVLVPHGSRQSRSDGFSGRWTPEVMLGRRSAPPWSGRAADLGVIVTTDRHHTRGYHHTARRTLSACRPLCSPVVRREGRRIANSITANTG
jgi:hypothetical protein